MRQKNEVSRLVSLLSCGKEHKYLNVSLSAKTSNISKDSQPSSQLSFLKLWSSLRCIADFEQKLFVPNLHQALNHWLKGWNFPNHGCPLTTSYLEALEVLSGRVLILVTENSVSHFLAYLVECAPKNGGSWWYLEMLLQALAGEKKAGGMVDVFKYRNHFRELKF